MKDNLFDQEAAANLLLDYLDNNNSESLEQFCMEVRPLALVIARQLGAVDEDDAAQEAIIHLLKILDRFDRQPHRLRAWLSIVIRNRIVSAWRYENTHHPPGIDPEVAEEEPVEDVSLAEHGIDRQLSGLSMWLKKRFPSLRNSDEVAQLIMDGLLDGTPPRQVVKTLMARAQPTIQANEATVVWQSATVFLRMLSLPDGRLDLSPIEPSEFSLIPELSIMVGVAPAQLVSVLFGGLTIKLQSTNNKN